MSKHTRKNINIYNLQQFIKNIQLYEEVNKEEAIKKIGSTRDTIRNIINSGEATIQTYNKIKKSQKEYYKKTGKKEFDLDLDNEYYKKELQKELADLRQRIRNIEKTLNIQYHKKQKKQQKSKNPPGKIKNSSYNDNTR